MSDRKITDNLFNVDIWIRLAYMVVFAFLIMIGRVLIWTVAVLQFLFVLFSGSDNRNLRNFGQGLSKWVYQGLGFLTFNTEEKPFPFSDWPEIEETEGYQFEPAASTDPQDTVAEEQVGGEAEVELDDDESVPSFTESGDQSKPSTDKPLKAD